jgi:cell division protein FtsI/penicillin-binding protein 2
MALILFIGFLPVLIILKMLAIQTDAAEVAKFKDLHVIYNTDYHTFTPARGMIYDRWGSLLAGNKMVYQVGVELKDVRNPETIARTVNLALGVDYSRALTQASLKPGEDAVYAVIADNIPKEKIDQLAIIKDGMIKTFGRAPDKGAPDLRGLVYSPHLARSYPERTLASNILGFVSGDQRGYFGVEEKFNDLLAGKPKMVALPVNPIEAADPPDVPDGANLILTIDRQVQSAMEQVIDKAVKETGSTSGTLVVLDPKTGELIASAATTRLDLNEYWRSGQVFPAGAQFDRVVATTYEPGSIYKVLTMSSALDKGAVKLETTFLDRGVFEIGGTFIYNWNHGAWGPQTMTGCMQHSLNVCLAWVATQLGTKDFYHYMQTFGIGRMTGVDLAGENSGRLKTPGDKDWYDADLGANSFGQGVATTPIQMVTAVSAIANEGKIMAPHVVRSIVNKGYQTDIEKRVIAAPVRPETAKILTDMLAKSLVSESSDALVTGYKMAGKTGTAEIPTPFGYTSNQTNASFVGWGPVDDPKFVVFVWLEKPSSSVWGSVVAAPVFSEAVSKLVVLLNIPPDDVRRQLRGQ